MLPTGGYFISGAGGGRANGLLGGRPPSILRERLAGTLADRIPVIESIADGTPVKNVEVLVNDLLPYAACPNCGEPMEASDAAKSALITIQAKESASPGDRIRALDLAAKYGLGTKDEVTLVSPDVRARLEATVGLVASQTQWNTDELLARLDAVWVD